MASALDRAKRIFVALLKTLAATYGVALSLNRESSDDDVRSAFKKVSRKVHPGPHPMVSRYEGSKSFENT